MKRIIVYGLVMLMMLSGCASYRPTSAPVPQTSTMSAITTEGMVTVGAEAFTQGEKQKECFGGDLCGAGVIPIQVMVRNEDSRMVLIRPTEIYLLLPGGSQISEAGPFAAAAKMESIGGVVASGIAFGLVGVLVASQAEDKARAARKEDYKRKELQEARLANGESANGFLYFIPAEGTRAFDDAEVIFRIVYVDDASSQTIRLPLTKIGYKAKEAAQ